MAQVLGRVRLVADGQAIRIEKGAKLNVGGITRTPVVATDESIHHSEETKEATLEFSAIHTADLDVAAIHAMTNTTFNFLGDNGVKYVMSSAFSMEPPDITDDGKVAFKFAGSAAIKQ
jgi:hypothetical protein